MLNLVEVDTSNRRLVKQFLDLPNSIYRQLPQWVPPFASEAAHVLNRKKHPFFRHSSASFYMAERSNHVVGRIAILNNRNYNQFNHERTAFFTLFECEDDLEASRLLFDTASHWAKAQGLDTVFGPKGFTALDGMGLLVSGFDYRPALGIPYNPDYYPRLVESAGFHNVGDIVSGHLKASSPFPEKIDQLASLVSRKRGLQVIRFRSRRELRRVVSQLRDVYNSSLGGTSGNVPLTDDEIKVMASQIEWFANPRLIKLVMKGDELVGFLLAYPDVSAALQRTHGRLFPFGWLDILLELRRTRWVNVNGAGIIEKYRGLGGTALLFSEMHKSVVECGYEHADIVQIGADNDKMQRELRDLGVEFYKTHRMYKRILES